MNISLYSWLSNRLLLQQKNITLMKTLLGKSDSFNENKRDTFIKSDGLQYAVNTYSANPERKTEYISEDILEIINNDISQLRKHGNVYECKGIEFFADQIPKVDGSNFEERKAVNNIIDFSQKKYFKYLSSDGGENYLYAREKGIIGAINSEVMRGAPHDAEVQKYAYFWNSLMRDTTFLGLNYSQKEIMDYLDEAEIQPGFFTVKMAERESVKFYSTWEHGVGVYEKGRYDDLYKNLTEKGNLLRDYDPGSVFKFGGNEYILKNDHTVDIPYGEDIFARVDPDNYKFGKKVNEL